MRRLLVTGGSGFIGSHLVEAIATSGAGVLNIDTKPPQIDSHRTYWRGLNLLDLTSLEALVREYSPDVIINLAGVADLSLRFEDMRVNFLGVEHLLEAAASAAPQTRLIHLSTQLVVEPGYRPAHARDYAPYTDYGRTKAASEEVLWNRGDNICWTIARPTTVWGPFHPTFAHSTWRYLNRRWYMIPTGTNPIRSFGYVANVVAQLLRAAQAPSGEVDRRTFYVGDEPMPHATWLDAFSYQLTGKPTRRVPSGVLRSAAYAGEGIKRFGVSAPFDLGRLYRISTDYAVPMGPSIGVLGAGRVPLDEGVAQTVSWLREASPLEYGAS